MKNEWISVKDRLPRLWMEVLLCHTDGTIVIGNRRGWGFMFEDIYGPVTHWMLLPAPPAGRREEHGQE